jgi:hypothetical protein
MVACPSSMGHEAVTTVKSVHACATASGGGLRAALLSSPIGENGRLGGELGRLGRQGAPGARLRRPTCRALRKAAPGRRCSSAGALGHGAAHRRWAAASPRRVCAPRPTRSLPWGATTLPMPAPWRRPPVRGSPVRQRPAGPRAACLPLPARRRRGRARAPLQQAAAIALGQSSIAEGQRMHCGVGPWPPHRESFSSIKSTPAEPQSS